MRFHQSSVDVLHQPKFNGNVIHQSNGNALNNNNNNNCDLQNNTTNKTDNSINDEIVKICINSCNLQTNNNFNINTDNIRNNIVQFKTNSKYFNDYLKNQNCTNNNNNNHVESETKNVLTDNFTGTGEFDLSNDNITKVSRISCDNNKDKYMRWVFEYKFSCHFKFLEYLKISISVSEN
jgi:hypothetical protein